VLLVDLVCCYGHGVVLLWGPWWIERMVYLRDLDAHRRGGRASGVHPRGATRGWCWVSDEGRGGGVVWADDGMTVCVGDGVGFLGNRNVYSFGSVAEVRKEVRARPLPDQGIS
jgi:hypothetical protein